ncbi:hypothetical protein ASPWEDRAFT_45304 [Aspergillus wentii DTO 134E9]|uniref:Protein-S-isoprenylcysteine O-methyltransferase n=1 Tax=Aspergillus wentii DTO 134E9 TaxID=1073089 RepID=A0A1L9R8X6_ASPWE|nr:uncharacterized protein ASPWEDRAFT_45304 [Aspergillus wentii DTO 134E9]KAI9926591.1 hypothetical protein MW887_004360 [Aspergillus wentii]OJJ31359.1 hypothetical protein ASPWEDRAFT_45304 [Aspergillus wentii DTO 134E9]
MSNAGFIPSLLFTCALSQASYLLKRSFERPNPDPNDTQKEDSMGKAVLILYGRCMSLLLISIGVAHGLYVLFPSTGQAICPSASSLNPALFSWSLQATIILSVSLFGGYLRLLAYHQLRENFTFKLSRPSQLVKSGIYAYVQHPSYIGFLAVICGYSALVLRVGGLLSCWTGHIPVSGVVYGGWTLIVAPLLVCLPARILDEERMLRRCFGKEWEEYNRSTARLVPWVF